MQPLTPLQIVRPTVSDLFYFLLFLAGWIVLYLIGRLGWIKSTRVKIYPLALIYRIESVEKWLDKLLVKPRLIRLFSDISIITGYVLMAYVVWFLFNNLLNFLKASFEFAPIVLLIPGITVRSPNVLPYFLLAIPIILTVHEAMHGFVARVEKLKVRSGGVGFALLFILGFVEPDEEEFKAARPRSKARVLAAGSGANIVLVLILTPLMLGTSTSLGVPPVAPLLPDPVRDVFYFQNGVIIAGVDPNRGLGAAGALVGDVLVQVNERGIKNYEELRRISLRPGEPVTAKVLRNGREITLSAVTQPHPEDATKGVLYIITRPQFNNYEPRFYKVHLSRELHSAIFWVWFLSFAVGMFNMLPMKPLDGHGLLTSSLEGIMKNSIKEKLLWIVSVGSLLLLAGNLIASWVNFGLLAL